MFRRRFFKDKGTSSIRNPIPEAGLPPSNGSGDIIVTSLQPCLRDGTAVYKACVTPAVADRSALASGKSLCTRIPSSPIDPFGTSECFVAAETKLRLLKTPKFPCSPPISQTSKAYELRPHESKMDRGMFATRALKIGDLILVERPLVLVCNNSAVVGNLKWIDPSGPPTAIDPEEISKSVGVFQAILEVLFNRLSKEGQTAYLALPNAHKDDPTLVGIWRTNNTIMYRLDLANEEYTYSAMFRNWSGINHNCQPNCGLSFDPASLSIQVRATMPIPQGGEILRSCCDPTISTTQRTAWLAEMGTTCACPSCVYDPSIPRNDSIRSSIPKRLKELEILRLSIPTPSDAQILTSISTRRMVNVLSQNLQERHRVALSVRGEACKLIDDIKAEGMEGCICYLEALTTRCFATMELSSASQYDKSLSSSSMWDWEVKKLAKDVMDLHRAHHGSTKKHAYEIPLAMGLFD